MQQNCVDYFLDKINRDIGCRYFVSWNSLFQDKNLLIESSGEYDEGCENVFGFDWSWRPKTYQFASNVQGGGDGDHPTYYRNAAWVLLQRSYQAGSNLSALAEIESLISRQNGSSLDWIIHMYFYAMWSREAAAIERFLDGLESFLFKTNCARTDAYKFDEIGEVKYLRGFL